MQKIKKLVILLFLYTFPTTFDINAMDDAIVYSERQQLFYNEIHDRLTDYEKKVREVSSDTSKTNISNKEVINKLTSLLDIVKGLKTIENEWLKSDQDYNDGTTPPPSKVAKIDESEEIQGCADIDEDLDAVQDDLYDTYLCILDQVAKIVEQERNKQRVFSSNEKETFNEIMGRYRNLKIIY